MTHIVERIAGWLVGPAIGAAMVLDRLAHRTQTPAATPTPRWVGREALPSVVLTGPRSTAGSPTQAPAAVYPPAPPPDGTGPHLPAGRSHPRRGRHASGRVLWGPYARSEVAA